MGKKQMSRLRGLKKEAEDLKRRIDNYKFKPKEPVIDMSASDYRTGFPRPIVNVGYGDKEYIKAKDKLYNQYVRKLIAVEKEKNAIENYIESVSDPELRTILRLRYVDGMKLDDIASEVGYCRETIKRRLKYYE